MRFYYLLFPFLAQPGSSDKNHHLLEHDNAQEGDENRNTSCIPRNLGFTLSFITWFTTVSLSLGVHNMGRRHKLWQNWNNVWKYSGQKDKYSMLRGNKHLETLLKRKSSNIWELFSCLAGSVKAEVIIYRYVHAQCFMVMQKYNRNYVWSDSNSSVNTQRLQHCYWS